MSKVLVLGAAGMLGHKLCQLLPGLDHDVTGAVRGDTDALLAAAAPVYQNCRLRGGVDALDIATLAQIFLDERPEVVVNCIGVVKQREDASDRYLAVEINSALPHRLAKLCEASGARLVHFSTDCVFDGSAGNYAEDAASDAKDIYGKSKFLGETEEAEPAAITLRTSMIGRELRRPTHGLLEWILAQTGKTVRGFARAVFSGFSTNELARVVDLVIRRGADLRGTVHVAAEPIDKFELLGLVREIYTLDVTVEREVEFVCDRSLAMGRFVEATGYTPPPWREMIQGMYIDPTPYERIQRALATESE
jgi:dTDP-4-dehydrorhamnose reductase